VRLVASMNYEVPDDLHRRAKAAAAMEGLSLKAFLIRALEEAVARSEGPAPAR
jgi:predicted HicB family RNase H-like nuclease